VITQSTVWRARELASSNAASAIGTTVTPSSPRKRWFWMRSKPSPRSIASTSSWKANSPFPAHDEIGVPQTFLGQEARVGPAHHRDAARLPDPVGQPVGLRRRRGDRGDADHVGGEGLRHVDRLDVVDVDADVVSLVPHDRAEQHRPETRDADAAVDVEVRGFRLDEDDFPDGPLHRWISSRRGVARSEKFAQTLPRVLRTVKGLPTCTSRFRGRNSVGTLYMGFLA
jgi:hypothetical protein